MQGSCYSLKSLKSPGILDFKRSWKALEKKTFVWKLRENSYNFCLGENSLDCIMLI